MPRQKKQIQEVKEKSFDEGIEEASNDMMTSIKEAHKAIDKNINELNEAISQNRPVEGHTIEDMKEAVEGLKMMKDDIIQERQLEQPTPSPSPDKKKIKKQPKGGDLVVEDVNENDEQVAKNNKEEIVLPPKAKKEPNAWIKFIKALLELDQYKDKKWNDMLPIGREIKERDEFKGKKYDEILAELKKQ